MEKNLKESTKVEKTKKGKTWLTIVLFVVGLVIGLGGTICLYEFTDFKLIKDDGKQTQDNSNKDKTEVKEDTDKEKDKDKKEELSSNEQKEIMNAIDKLAFIDFNNKDVTDLKKLSAKTLMWLALEDMNFSFDGIETVSTDKITKTLDNMLSDYNLEFTDLYDFGCDEPFYKYDSNKKVLAYNEEHGGHGGGRYETSITNRFVEGYKKDDKYTVVVYKLFGELTDIGFYTKYYASYQNAKDEKNPVYTIDLDEVNDDEFGGFSKEETKKILNDTPEDKLIKHTYEFIKENNNYKLVSYKIG